MMPILTLAAALAMAVTLRGIWSGGRQLAHTTLTAAWRWAMAAGVAWSLTWCLDQFDVVSSTGLDALWYGAALLALCPPIAVLGAKRPGAGVWTAFVVLPMLAVLGWPLLTLWGSVGEIPPLRLETPQLLGFVLVLLMGAGNYLGTRFGLSAALYVVAVCLAVAPTSAVAPTFLSGSPVPRQLATICLGLTVLTGKRRKSAVRSESSGLDRLWSDYRDLFGIVWARRFQDRLNGIARQQKWPAHLSDHGLVWDHPATGVGVAPDDEPSSSRIEQTFRWLLRRFVDPEWIDERLNAHRALFSAVAAPAADDAESKSNT